MSDTTLTNTAAQNAEINGGSVKIRDLRKSFNTAEGRIDVLKGVNIDIQQGDIYGVIGFSGAGKSTLARCINRLENPDSGNIIIGGTDITALPYSQLIRRRRKIGMIFQTFNLFDSMTVFKNVAYPLKIQGTDKKRISERVYEILELVGLTEKAKAYPAQLSGGQKQRVGIARALANEPSLLLSDEATSALDPQTTLSVLELLKEVNKKLGLTILLITHEMEVIKYACNNMAVLEDGLITERGTVQETFSNPNSRTGRIFLQVYSELRKDDFVAEGEGI